jgi:hypothetical protein
LLSIFFIFVILFYFVSDSEIIINDNTNSKIFRLRGRGEDGYGKFQIIGFLQANEKCPVVKLHKVILILLCLFVVLCLLYFVCVCIVLFFVYVYVGFLCFVYSCPNRNMQIRDCAGYTEVFTIPLCFLVFGKTKQQTNKKKNNKIKINTKKIQIKYPNKQPKHPKEINQQKTNEKIQGCAWLGWFLFLSSGHARFL